MFTILELRKTGVWTGTPGDWLATKVIFLPVIALSAVAIAMGLAEAT